MTGSLIVVCFHEVKHSLRKKKSHINSFNDINIATKDE